MHHQRKKAHKWYLSADLIMAIFPKLIGCEVPRINKLLMENVPRAIGHLEDTLNFIQSVLSPRYKRVPKIIEIGLCENENIPTSDGLSSCSPFSGHLWNKGPQVQGHRLGTPRWLRCITGATPQRQGPISEGCIGMHARIVWNRVKWFAFEIVWNHLSFEII